KRLLIELDGLVFLLLRHRGAPFLLLSRKPKFASRTKMCAHETILERSRLNTMSDRETAPSTVSSEWRPNRMSWYPSKVDLWLAVLLWVMPVVVVVAWITALTSGSNDDLVAAMVASVLVVGILFGLVYPM